MKNTVLGFVKFTGFSHNACMSLPVGSTGKALRVEIKEDRMVTFVKFPCRSDVDEVDLFDDEFLYYLRPV